MKFNEVDGFFEQLRRNGHKSHIPEGIRSSYECNGFFTSKQRLWLRNNWDCQNGYVVVPDEIKRILRDSEAEDRAANPDTMWFVQDNVMYQKTVMKLDDVKPESVGVNIILANLFDKVAHELNQASVLLRS
jgi:hypothetical protein